MNLYAVLPVYAPGEPVELILAASDQEAMELAVHVRDDDYGSPAVDVYAVALNVAHVGEVPLRTLQSGILE